MKIEIKSNLSQEQKEIITQLWNNEYPKQIGYETVADFEKFLDGITDHKHFLLFDENENLKAWLVSFNRDGERWFSIIVDSSEQKKGYGTRLLNEVKQYENELNGWVVSNNDFPKTNGEKYISPIKFYDKNGFTISENIRNEKANLYFVKINWKKKLAMKKLVKPKALQTGDKVAAISLSWGGAGTFPHRFEAGKKQIEEVFGVEVVATKNALKSAEWIYRNPQARAEDLMEAFADNSIKAIISNIGGDDSIRTLPFIDLAVIKKNPKIFLGFSDTTVTHFACLKAGLSTFYGTSLMVGFAENCGMHLYQIEDIRRTLFSNNPIGEIKPNLDGWTSQRLDWGDKSLQNVKRKINKPNGWNFLQGTGKHFGNLVGGCVEVLEFLKGTDYWLEKDDWNNTILFLETSEELLNPTTFIWILRNYAAQGIFQQSSGIILGRPDKNQYVNEYNQALLQVIRNEQGLSNFPIVTEMDFGHTCPTFTIPIGAKMQIDCDNKIIEISENSVI